MEFRRLSSEDRRAFDEDGFLVIPEALDSATVERLSAACDQLARPFLEKPVIAGKPEYNHLNWRPGLLRDEAMLELVTSSPAVPYIVQLLGPNIHLHSTSLTYKRPEAPETPAFRRGWHRDIRIPKDVGQKDLPRAGIKVCYCLTDFDRPNCGMTLMARGSHLLTEPMVVPPGQIDPVGVEVCDLQAKAGDAILFENRTFHTAAPNLSDRTSKVLIYGYTYRWMKQEIYLDNPDPRELAHLDPMMRQLLGECGDIDAPPWALLRWAERHGIAVNPVQWTREN